MPSCGNNDNPPFKLAFLGPFFIGSGLGFVAQGNFRRLPQVNDANYGRVARGVPLFSIIPYDTCGIKNKISLLKRVEAFSTLFVQKALSNDPCFSILYLIRERTEIRILDI